MTLVIIISVFLALAFYLVQKTTSTNTIQSNTYHPHPYYNKAYEIKGIGFRELHPCLHGPLKGYIKAEPENEYDQYAIAVYKNSYGRPDTLVGYLPKGNKELSLFLQANGEMKVSGALGVNGYDPLKETYQDILDCEEDLPEDNLYWEGAVILKELKPLK